MSAGAAAASFVAATTLQKFFRARRVRRLSGILSLTVKDICVHDLQLCSGAEPASLYLRLYLRDRAGEGTCLPLCVPTDDAFQPDDGAEGVRERREGQGAGPFALALDGAFGAPTMTLELFDRRPDGEHRVIGATSLRLDAPSGELSGLLLSGRGGECSLRASRRSLPSWAAG